MWESTLTLASEGLWVESPEGFATCPLSDVCSRGSPVIISLLLKPAPTLVRSHPVCGPQEPALGDKDLPVPSGWPAAGRRVAWGLGPGPASGGAPTREPGIHLMLVAPSPSVTTAPQAEPCGTIPLPARRAAGSEGFLPKGN